MGIDILIIIKEFLITHGYKIFCLVIILFTLFQGRILSFYSGKQIKRILESLVTINEKLKNDLPVEYEILKKLEEEVISDSKLEEKMKDYYDSIWKYRMYFMLGLVSLSQLVFLLFGTTSDMISSNLAMLTMIVSIIEVRDNKITSQKINDELKTINKNLIKDYFDIMELKVQEIVLKNTEIV